MSNEMPIELKKSQLQQAAEMLARVFQEGTFYKAVIPDASERKRALPFVFKFRLKLGMRYAKVFANSTKLEGVINMFSPGDPTLSLWKFIKAGVLSAAFKVPKGTFSTFMTISRFFEERHEALAPFPHYSIASLGVDPRFQGKGIGGRLLRFVLQKADAAGLPCYLETQDKKNVLIYEHLGFKIIEENALPIINIKNWVLIREPVEK